MPCAVKLAPTKPEHPSRSDHGSPTVRIGAKRLSVAAGFAAIAALFSIGAGAAASQGASSRGFGAETKVVSSCGTGMRFVYTTSYDSETRAYVIDAIVVSDIPATCLNRKLAVTFYDDADGTAVGSPVTTILPSSGTTDVIPIDPRSNTVEAGLVSGVSVAIA